MIARAVILTLLYLSESCLIEGGLISEPETRLKLVIDNDGGADDAWAITSSLLYEKYFNGPKVVALTAVHGNVNLSQAIINNARILKLCNRSDIPIYAGAQRALIKGIPPDYFFGYDGLGDDGYMSTGTVVVETVPAAIGLIELSKKHRGDLIVVAIGADTNIALAKTLDPNFVGRLSQLYVGAGHIYSQKYPNAEFNAAMDPEAYSIVASRAKADKVTFVPYSQVYESLNITKKWRTNVLGKIDTPIIKALNGYERLSLATDDNIWNLLDIAVTAIMLEPNIVKEYKYSNNGIILCGAQRGVNTNNFTSEKPNSRIVYSAILEKYKKFLIKVYSSPKIHDFEDDVV